MKPIRHAVSDNGWAISEGVVTSDGKCISFCISIDDAVDEDLELANTYPDFFFFDKMPWVKPEAQNKMPLNKFIELAQQSPTEAIEIYDLNDNKVINGPMAREGKSMVYNENGTFKELKLPNEN
ncbi:hypothetical protein A2962_00460 [Candidatus Woesebacteria bacterium RIFCSPLOWO2_01_FULL_39_61]|uniref:Uncharacterized protein n=1 Tax=Candidatus Woesebacteria bacterium RIFCSPHIGHO2_02_FULL_39_13 TaxID=1802505 RepID=A0A1F7Z4A5_9BACT|nr:MAG: hypothetical protein A2692_03770 [Candidatus Woesebacteria bacterium RIFCSPHIGHO2_01_FULL_39_95]OGM33615.1 MAG: hypothetical protein A3D01_01535 [Candidatus Woesebacteria bacterium RIFCSPHIGHO2_02_FULL_39_13]OGM37308.1 MAG: hypothetical protein A3E13_05240 [Candidatus Woesebacteria bacterium RIFCSPHIGHO2_12_FULL_40_20]OGM68526.1 MAG: hypothetical protein A2962_00460 [Candidatus Woesebacteria bacterium RIFCSPLOWO2_01_FULL_39_61]OGM73455.1 MAG: hypothetical protein A3H19_00880 [Candidatus